MLVYEGVLDTCLSVVARGLHFERVADFLIFFALIFGLALYFVRNRETWQRLALALGVSVAMAAVLVSSLSQDTHYLDLSPTYLSVSILLGAGVAWYFVAHERWQATRLFSVALGYAVSYGCALAGMPYLMSEMETKAAGLPLFGFMGFLAAVVYVLMSLGWGDVAPSRETSESGVAEQDEHVTVHLARDATIVRATLDAIRDLVRRYRNDPRAALGLSWPHLAWLESAEQGATQALARLGDLEEILANADESSFAALHERLAHLPANARQEACRQLAVVRSQLRLDERKRRARERLVLNARKMLDALTQVKESLGKGNAGRALRSVEHARRLDHDSSSALEELRALVARYRQEVTRQVTRAALASRGDAE